jgi:O-antigen ligase
LFFSGTAAALTVWWEALVSHSPLFVDKSTYYWNNTGQYIFRPGGVFGSPPGAAAVLAMTSICGLALIARSAGGRRTPMLLCLAVSIVALVFTFTRGGMIGFGIGLVVYVLLLGPRMSAKAVYFGVVAMLGLALFVLPAVSGSGWYQKGVLRQGTLAERETFWSGAWPVIEDSRHSFLLGHGINSLVVGRPELPGTPAPDIAASPTLSRYSPHNQYIRTLVEQGLVGLALLVAAFLAVLLKAVSLALRVPGLRTPAAAAAGAVSAFAVISLVGDSLRHPPTFAVVATIAGLVAGVHAPAVREAE